MLAACSKASTSTHSYPSGHTAPATHPRLPHSASLPLDPRCALLAAWRVWRMLLEAAFLPNSGHKRSIACSRCMRWPAARESNLTRLAAFLSRQAPSSTVLILRQPESRRAARCVPPRFALQSSNPAGELIPFHSRRSRPSSYKIGTHGNESPMNQTPIERMVLVS